MLIQSKARRRLWRNILLNTVPDLLLAAIIAYVADTGWVGFIVAYFGLQILYVLIWLKNTLWGWAMFYLFGRKEAVQHIVGVLREKSFPEPDDLILDGLVYVREVAESHTALDEARLEAAGINGTFAYITTNGQMQQGVRFQMALEDAIQLYKASFPPPASRASA